MAGFPWALKSLALSVHPPTQGGTAVKPWGSRSLNAPVTVRGIFRGRALEEHPGLEYEYDHDGTTTFA